MPESDVESDIYESLYGVPRRERGVVGPSGGPIVIVDGALRAAPRDMDVATAVPPSLRGAPSRRLADRLLEPLAAGTQALRSRPAAAALTAALILVPVLALLLAAAGRSGAARVRLATPPSRSAVPAMAAIARPAPAPRHSADRPTATASASAGQTADAAGAANPAPQTQRLSDLHRRAHRAKTTHRPDRVVTRPTPPPPIRRPTAHERPAPKPPATTAPATGPGTPSGQGGGLPNITGGQPAPTD